MECDMCKKSINFYFDEGGRLSAQAVKDAASLPEVAMAETINDKGTLSHLLIVLRDSDWTLCKRCHSAVREFRG